MTRCPFRPLHQPLQQTRSMSPGLMMTRSRDARQTGKNHDMRAKKLRSLRTDPFTKSVTGDNHGVENSCNDMPLCDELLTARTSLLLLSVSMHSFVPHSRFRRPVSMTR